MTIHISECQEFVSEDVVSIPGVAGYGVTTHAVSVGGGHWVSIIYYWSTQESHWDRTEYYLLMADGKRRPIPAGSMEAAEAWVRREVAWDEARPFTANVIERGERPAVFEQWGPGSCVTEWVEFDFDPPLASLIGVTCGTGRQAGDGPRNRYEQVQFNTRVYATYTTTAQWPAANKISFSGPITLAGSGCADGDTIFSRVEKLGYRVVEVEANK